MLEKIVYAGANGRSFRDGSQTLRALAELEVAEKQVERLTEAIGRERIAQRERAVAAYLARPLMEKLRSPRAEPPELAVVQMDGGRLQIRDRGSQGAEGGTSEPADEAEESEPRRGHWREDKIGLLLSMTSPVAAEDPCPEIPEHFVDPTRILTLARQIHSDVTTPEGAAPEPPAADPATADPPWVPEPAMRATVATRGPGRRFGAILAQAAWTLGFAAARRKAFVADGAAVNWTIHRRHFSDYVPILDFIHALSYVFAAAMAGRSFREGWPAYECWIGLVWKGQVEPVIAALETRQAEVGLPAADEPSTSPRAVLAASLSFLSNQRGRMRYAAYRRQGLPMTSSHIESTVKLFNRRVKGTEKFWSESGAEAVLQLRADYLSETEPLTAYWEQRQAEATGRRPYRRTG